MSLFDTWFQDPGLGIFYATLTQVMTAFFAVTAIFFVYRVQDQRRKIEVALKEAREALYKTNPPGSIISAKGVKNCLEKSINASDTTESEKSIYKEQLQNIRTKEENEENIRESRKCPFRVTTGAILLLLIALFFNNSARLGTKELLFTLVSLSCIFSFWTMSRFIKDLLEKDQLTTEDK